MATRQTSMHTFSGQLGSTVGYLKYGENYERMLGGSKNPKNPKTPKQIAVRIKFTVIQQFAAKIAGFLNYGFKSSSMPATSAFFKKNHNDIIAGTSPNFNILYDKTVVAVGSLLNPYSPNAVVESNTVTVSWTDNSNVGNAKATDNAMLLAYNSVKCESVYTPEGGTRSQRQASLTLPSAWSGDSIDIWFAMRSIDGQVSNSIYLGNFSI